MKQEIIHKDIIVLGGGVAGLWILNSLVEKRYDTILLESDALGAGQSVASQGMIHGGIKYALGGALTGASDAIADMPDFWTRSLQGKTNVNLDKTRVLSTEYYMWPKNSFRSRLNAFLGSKALRGRVQTVHKRDYPDFFKGNIDGPLYLLKDIVLDVPSLLHNLFDNQQDKVFKYDFSSTRVAIGNDGTIEALHIKANNGSELVLSANTFIVTSGAGAQDFLDFFPHQQTPAKMQLRPLKMLIVKHNRNYELYAHCISDQLSLTPELTITTHKTAAGDYVWYLGGEIAEQGVERSDEEQIAFAKQKLSELFPWCSFQDSEWRCFDVNRAEAAQKQGKRPDDASLMPFANTLFCWPTKLTLAPNLARQVENYLQEHNITPTGCKHDEAIKLDLPEIAITPWDNF